MAGIKISELDTGTPLATDETPATDIQDTSSAPSGTTKKYIRSSELNWIIASLGGVTVASVRVATTGALTATYANGAAGVGATLTNSGALAALSIDSVALAVGNRVLVKDQGSTFQNGVYTVTVVGTAGIAWVLTRATDYDAPGDVVQYAYIPVNEGTVNANLTFQETGAGPFTIGTTPITFALAASLGGQYVTSITGTANQVVSSSPTGNVTLSLPQSIATTSTPTFATLTLTSPLTGANGGTGVNNGASTLTLAGNLATSGAFPTTFTMTGATNVTFPTSGTLSTTSGTVTSVSGTANRITSTGGATPVIDISASYVGQSSITTLGTIGTGAWQGTLIGGTYGGTGVNNGVSTITLGGSLVTSGAFASTFTMTGITNVTFPTSGTLLTSAGAVTSLAATANQTTVSGATGAVTTGLASNAILPGTGGVTLPQGNTAARAGGAGTIRFNTQAAVFESTVDGATWAIIDTSASGDVDSIIGTANQVIASNPTGNVTLSLPQSIATSSGVTFGSMTFSTTSGIIGTTTNNDAAAGSVGEMISSVVASGSAVSLTNGTTVNITSISLTAGDWDVWGYNAVKGTNGAVITRIIGGISQTSATLGDETATNSSYGISGLISITLPSSPPSLTLRACRISLASTTTIYLVMNCNFTVQPLSGYGTIIARRRR